MILSALLIAIIALLLPQPAWAWGTVTHLAIGERLLILHGELLPSIASAISREPASFLLGNLMPDLFTLYHAVPFVRPPRNIHGWRHGLSLVRGARTESERAFGWGFLSHIAADRVAHGELIPGEAGLFHRHPLTNHLIIEYRIDAAWGRERLRRSRDLLLDGPASHLISDILEVDTGKAHRHRRLLAFMAEAIHRCNILERISRVEGEKSDRLFEKVEAHQERMFPAIVTKINGVAAGLTEN